MDIISTVQAKTNGNYGLVSGTHTAGQPSGTFTRDEEIDAKEAITQLSDERGFDWSITVDREVNTYYPRRGSDLSATYVFEHLNNCVITSLPEDASPGAINNYVKVKGGDNASKFAENTASQATYGRREAIVDYSDEQGTPSKLQSFANQMVATRKDTTVVMEVKLDTLHPDYVFGTPWLGDIIRVIGDIGRAPYQRVDSLQRVVGVHVELDEQNYESVTLEVNPYE
jgi:hypothetical protein